MPREPIFTRRRVLKAAVAGVVCVAADALVVEPRWLRVSRHEVVIPALPRALEGFTIAQITDAHLTGLGRVEDAILAELRRVGPQLVVLTGDLIDASEDLEALAELCAELRQVSPQVLATLGNWEHWGELSIPSLAGTYARSGARLLIDEWHAGDGGVAVYASDDATAGRPRALGGVAKSSGAAVELLLTHSPAFVDGSTEAASSGFDLCLAGHTHGGQIRAGSFAPIVPPGSGRFVAGWYETPTGPLYVSSGTGTSIVPARFCCRPELPIFTLVS